MLCEIVPDFVPSSTKCDNTENYSGRKSLFNNLPVVYFTSIKSILVSIFPLIGVVIFKTIISVTIKVRWIQSQFIPQIIVKSLYNRFNYRMLVLEISQFDYKVNALNMECGEFHRYKIVVV